MYNDLFKQKPETTPWLVITWHMNQSIAFSFWDEDKNLVTQIYTYVAKAKKKKMKRK